MAKKIDYASMYTLRKDGRYMCYWHDDNEVRHSVYDHNAKKLYWKIQDLEKPKVRTFGEVAEEWKAEHWQVIATGSKANYDAPYKLVLAEHFFMP